jgi:FtsP/CotA-like multicopper oxidase with cupredoxin domain
MLTDDKQSNKKTATSDIDRRTFLGSVGLTGVATLLSSSFLSVLGTQKAFANSENVKTYNLDVDFAPVDNALPLRTYNKLSPGPTMRVKANENLAVNLTNSLPVDNTDCVEDHNSFHGANTTNLHTHGLHISPTVSSNGRYEADNIFLKIVPEDQEVPCWNDSFRRHSAQYLFELPSFHPSGTLWSHAHKHGSTAQQVANGLVGPLIVDDPKGYMPSYIENAKEDIFMIQMRDLTEDKPKPSESGGVLAMVLVKPEGGGIKNPTILMRPGEVRRWRFINAAPRADAFVNLTSAGDRLDIWQIAYDGLTLDRRVKVDPTDNHDPWVNHAALAPGNRTDFMVHVPKDAVEGTQQLLAIQPTDKVMSTSKMLAAAEPIKINIVIAGPPVDDEWSENDALPGSGHKPIIQAPDHKRKIEFGIFSRDGKTVFGIDGHEFDGKVKQTMKLNTVEEWTIENSNPFTHPFHIHVNPFFITHIDGKKLAPTDPRRRWQDTIALPTKEGDTNGSITFLSRYETFTGKFVIHCHILEHEDEGMMQVVEVIE